MTDYTDLHRRLWQLIHEMDGRLEGGARATAAKLIEQLAAEGYQAGPDTQAELTAYLDSIDTTLRAGIAAAIPLGSPVAMGDALISRLTEEAFTRTWQDGKNLSTRIWQFKGDTRRGFTAILQQAARTGRGAGNVVYDMQRAIEARGARFQIVNRELDDWASLLAEAGKAAIHNKEARQAWASTVSQVRAHINNLAETGTRHAAEVAFAKIRAAVAAGEQELIGDALYWWFYDKQLFLLKRIARTEMATAQHRAVIASSIDDSDIIGFQWRLSSSHPEPDICDYYAGIEMGLGRGVWPKDQVPDHKAHPHCMCSLIPRVTKVKDKGAVNYVDFIQGVTPERQAALLPVWARDARKQGLDLAQLIRPDGLGLITKTEAQARFGADLIG